MLKYLVMYNTTFIVFQLTQENRKKILLSKSLLQIVTLANNKIVLLFNMFSPQCYLLFEV